MSETISFDFENNEQMPLHEFTEKAYLNYSMYVILDRALPNIADGLKPVQRRIIYAMSELGLKSGAKYKKSARTVGDVIGKFHPHGDSACYEAMVLMAQPFSYRYPLIDGQGNWGSIDDPKSFAAMRYTESKLTNYADNLLSEVTEGTVDWVPNFDGTLEEPRLLPARLPNILLNGTTGIAVGMATDIPPHNMLEVVTACIRLLDSSRTTIDELCKHVKGPDFPTVAEIITPRKEIIDIYKSGNGAIKMRAVWEKEDDNIIVTALPYQSSGSKVLEQIAAQMTAKKLPMLEDLRDESDHENPVRLVFIPRSNRVDLEQLMSHLFATTDLERSYRINFNMIGTDGRPRVKDLKSVLTEWLSCRLETVRRRLQFRLDKVQSQIHLLQGLMIAYLNIDEVIKIIREEDTPRPVLMKKFKLSDLQAEAILELKLRKLAKLEEVRIQGELDNLQKERKSLEQTLSSKQRLKTLVKNELKSDAEQFGDKRCSPVVERGEASAMNETQLIPTEPMTVILSDKGWVRAAKGHDIDPLSLNYRSGDGYLASAMGRSNQMTLFMDSTGRSYALATHSLPSARSLGEPVASRLNPPDGASFVGIMLGEADDLYLVASNAGYGFIVKQEDLFSKNKNGKAVLSVPKEGMALKPARIQDMKNNFIAAVTSTGRILVIKSSELPVMPKGKGLKIINIPSAKFKTGEESVIAVTVLIAGDVLQIQSGQRKMQIKAKDIGDYLSERGKRGQLLPRGYRNVSGISVERT